MDRRLAARYSSVIEVLERVLDKGIVIDAWVRVSPAEIDLLSVHARVVIASITTYERPAETRPVIPRGASRPGAVIRRATDMS